MNKYCQRCNTQNPSDAAFCRNCASPLVSVPSSGGGQNFAQPADANAGGASQRAIIALVLTIAGLFCCGPLTSIPAVIVGWMEADAIKKGLSSSAGMWMAQVGIWGGIIVTILTLIGGVLFLLLSASSPDAYYY